jgi:3-phosphoshikimate 1-carboxyvinyltransferase
LDRIDASSCDDAQAAARVARSLLARGAKPAAPLDCGESALCLRMFTVIAALRAEELTLTCRGSLLRRPVGELEAPLRALGATVRAANGFPPITVRGPLRGGTAAVDATLSSQLLTGLLLALPLCPRDSQLDIVRLTSKPYIEMTLAMARAAGAIIESDETFTQFRIPGRQSYRRHQPAIEADWSAAAFVLAAGALAGRVRARGLVLGSLQADRRVLDALALAGARLTASEDGLVVERDGLRAFSFDVTDCPDLAPALVALAVHCDGTSVIEGADRLVHKESNRAEALAAEFGKLGATVRFDGKRLTVVGGPLAGGEVDAHGDHRIAMALAVAALRAKGPVRITGANSVAKSYPGFFDDLARLTRGTT